MEGTAAGHAAEEDDLPDARGEVRVEGDRVLRDVCDPVPLAEPRNGLPEQLDLPAGRALEAEHQAKEGGLPAPVRPNDPEDLAPFHGEVHVPKDLLALALQGDAPNKDDRGPFLRHCGWRRRDRAHVHSRAALRFARFNRIRVK